MTDAVANARKAAEASLDTLNRALEQRVERKMAEQPDDMRTGEAEPVAWMDHMGGVITSAMKRQYELVGGRPTDYTIPLYASPPRMARGGILSMTRKMPRSSRLALLEAAVSDMEYLLRPALKAAEAEANRLRQRVKALEEGLAFYADKENWRHRPRSEAGYPYTEAIADGCIRFSAPSGHALALALLDYGRRARALVAASRK